MDVIREAVATYKPYDRYMAFYIAARYGRKAEAKELALQLQEMGYTVTSTWIDQVASEMFRESDSEPGEAATNAEKDYREIREANAIIYLSEEEENKWGRGGRHVEFGYAVGLGKILMVVGPLENIFHYHNDVLQFYSTDDLFAYLKEETA